MAESQPSRAKRPRSRRVLISTIIVTAILFTCCSIGIIFFTQQNPAGTQASPTATTSSTPHIAADAPILGGSVAAFSKKFGGLFRATPAGFGEYQYTSIAGETDMYISTHSQYLLDDTAPDRVYDITIGPPDISVSWSVTTTHTLCSQFLPPDSKLLSTTPYSLSSGTDGSLEKFHSNLLANTLPADNFVDADSHPTTPGDFLLLYMYLGANTPNQLSGCELTTDGSTLNP